MEKYQEVLLLTPVFENIDTLNTYITKKFRKRKKFVIESAYIVIKHMQKD